MATILREPGATYKARYDKVPLEKVAAADRTFQKQWIAKNGYDVTDDFIRYARPLVGEGMITLPMENGRQFQVGLYRHLVGDVVTLQILRDGKTQEVPVAMTERKEPLAGLVAAADPRDNLVTRLGILAVNLDKRIAELLPGLRTSSGVVVASTVLGALNAQEGGLANGDIIYAINRTPIKTLAELRAALDPLMTGDPVVLELERRGELMYLAFTVD